MQETNTFTDLDNIYFMLDYSPSHSQLILRSKKTKNRGYNIDILFKPVHTILMPTRIEGLKIELLEDKSIAKILIEEHGFDQLINIYLLRNRNNFSFYINASMFGVYNNDFDILETSFAANKFWLSEKNIIVI